MVLSREFDYDGTRLYALGYHFHGGDDFGSTAASAQLFTYTTVP
jgi:hypothetical protein